MQSQALYQNKAFLIFETFLVIILPLMFLEFYPSFYQYRTFAMLFGLFYCLVVIKTQRIGKQKLGFSNDNFLSSLRQLLPLTLIFILAFGVLRFLPWITDLVNFKFVEGGQNALTAGRSVFAVIVIYSLISVPLQEFIFRGFYISRLELVSRNRIFLVLYSAFIFMMIHMPLKSILFDVGSFGLGIWWADSFLKFRNLFSLMVVHAIVGGSLIYFLLFR